MLNVTKLNDDGLRLVEIAEVWQKSNFLLIKSDCSRIMQLIGWWIVTMLKNLKMALFRTFSTWHRILSALTALYWPSTAFYWPSTTKCQPVPPSTDPVPTCINYYHPLLIQYHQVSTSIATYWPSAIIYQPVPPSTDPVTPSTNRNRLLLTQYQPILLGLGDSRLLHSLPWVLFILRLKFGWNFEVEFWLSPEMTKEAGAVRALGRGSRLRIPRRRASPMLKEQAEVIKCAVHKKEASKFCAWQNREVSLP